MFPTFISILDIQSWWEVPSIAHFCSLFRTAFNLLDFDIEDLEEALLTDGTEESSWLQELIVRLLSGCLPQNEISTFNYQMFLRRLFRQKCQEHDRYNPFNTDVDFQLLPLRTKVDILHALCDFRLDADDVLDQLKNLDADSLRVEPLGYDSNNSAYWYFYGTRLYREDFQTKNNKKKSIWQVICFTEDDWLQLTKKFKKSTSKAEKLLHQALNENFLPELPRLFKEKERLARKRLLENQPRRTSSRIRKLEEEEVAKQQEVEEKEDSLKKTEAEEKEPTEEEKRRELERKRREAYERRSKLKEGSGEDIPPESCSEKGDKSEAEERYEMAGAKAKDKKTRGRQRKISTGSQSSKDEYAPKSTKKSKRSSDRTAPTKSPPKLATVGRQTNNSLSAATGQIVIQQEAAKPTKKKLKISQVFRQTDEDLQTGLHKILDFVKNHEDAWPFADPVDEEYAPNYYSIIRKPMDLQTMEERLDSGYYKNYNSFRSDFQLIVDNCRLYNGSENEYTEMVDNLLKVFDRATEKFLDQISSSDDEVGERYLDKNGSPVKKKKKGVNSRKSGSVEKKHDKSEESTKDDLGDIEDVPENKKKVKSNKNDTKNNSRKTDKKSTEKSSKSEKSSKKATGKTAKKNQEKNLKDKKKSKHKKEVEVEISSRSSTPPPPSDIESDISDTTPSWSPSPDRFNFSPKKVKAKKRKVSFSDDEEEVVKPKKSKLKDKDLKVDKSKKGDKLTKSGKSDKTEKTIGKAEKNEKSTKHGKLEKFPKTEKLNKTDGKSDKLSKEKNRHSENNKKDHIFKEKTKFDDFDDLDRFSPPPPPFSPKPKDKHNKLRETIEKLKAKSLSTKLKDPFDFKIDDTLKENKKRDKPEPIEKKTNKLKTSQLNEADFDTAGEISLNHEQKRPKKQKTKQNVATIEALTLATEQTLKDINKWLDDTPKMPEFSSASNSPAYGVLEEFDSPGNSSNNAAKVDNIKKDKKKEKDLGNIKKKKDPTKFFKRREVQRTIDRLQPGKSKGNLIATVTAKSEEQFPCPLVKKDSKNSLIVKTDTNAPKLSLGSVLDSFGKHKFVDEKKEEPTESPSVETKVMPEEEPKESKEKKEEKPEKEKEDDGGATPNLSAWFKAFGAPKVPQKRDPKEADEKDKKVAPPEPSPSLDSPQAQPTPRQRKISTGSSMSERSSFSQDMDSPRVGIDERGAYPAPYPSPLHRSPSGASPVMASPRPDVSPKAAAYPTFNGQMRVGFYQDTVSNKSSPDKSSCSPRDNPQSPYGQYSEHVYTPNQGTYPPYYGQYQYGEYYDTNKSLTDQYQAKAGQNYQQQQQQQQNSPQSQVNSPVPSPASCHDVPPSLPNSQPQNPQNIQQPHNPQNLQQPQQAPPAPQQQHQAQQSSYAEEAKNDKMMFPVKKRVYNEMPRYDNPQQTVPQQKEPYIQNIPDPKPLTIQTPENYSNGPSSLSPVQSYHNKQPYKNSSISPVPTATQNHYPAPNSPAPIYNPYNDPNYSNLPTSRSQDHGKLEMSKYTNMGYSGHDMNYPPRPPTLPQRHDYPSTSQLPPPSQDSSLRYTNLNTVQEINYKLPNEPIHNYPQRQESLPPTTNTNYKDIIPRTYQSMEQQPPGLRNLSHIVDRRGFENEVLHSNYYQQEKALNSHLFNKSMPPSSSAALPMFSQANVPGLAPPPSYNQSMQSSSTAVAAAMYSHRQMEMQNVPPVSGASTMANTEQKVAPPVVEKKKKGRKSKAEKAAAAAAAAAALQQQQQQQQQQSDASQPQQQQQQPPPPSNSSSNITNQGFQSYAGLKATSASAVTSEPSAISLKTSSVVPGSAFNFGPTPSGIGIGSGLYSSDKDAYPNFLDDFRSAPNYYMRDKQTSRVPAHQASAQSSSYAFLGTAQPRPSYPPIGGPFIPPPGQPPHVMDTGSSIYQHYIQAGVLNQGLLGPPGTYPPGYHPALSMRQPPYDSMPRPWL